MNWKVILKSLKSADMRNRILAVLGIIIIYRLMAHIPVPMANPADLRTAIDQTIASNSFGGFLNLLSGGALSNFSIVLVGMSPFITASVITQLLTKAVPKLEEMHNDGESGRRKINQWTRIIAFPLAILQSIAFIIILQQTVLQGSTTITDIDISHWIVGVSAMVAGSMMLMWFGEIITEKGIGNGISLVIFAGIVSQLPQTLGLLWSSLFVEGSTMNIFNWFTLPINGLVFWLIIAMAGISLEVLYFLVKINEGQRIITINYAKRVRGNSAYGGVKSILPIKLITAGVIPVIFAVAFLAIPTFIGQLFVATGYFADVGQNLILWFQTPNNGTSFTITGEWTQFIYPASYFVLVVFFTYFYTSIVFNSKEISENLQKQGGFVAGVRPGKQTEKYLGRIVTRLTLFGSLSLGLIAIIPFAFEYVLATMGIRAANLSLGGTGLLIVVSVGLESLRQLNSRALMVTYDEYK